MYGYVHARTCKHVYVHRECMDTCIRVLVSMYTYMCIRGALTFENVCLVRMHACIRMLVCMYTYVCIRMYVYVCMYTYVCIRMYVYAGH